MLNNLLLNHSMLLRGAPELLRLSEIVLLIHFWGCEAVWGGVRGYEVFSTTHFFQIFISSGNVCLPSEHNRKMVFYSLYSFGVPALFTGIVLIINYFNEIVCIFYPSYNLEGTCMYDEIPHVWRPGYGETSCWFSSDTKGIFYYFYV